MNALILGCGNIGAYYDWETDDVKTYAKAFHLLGVDFSVYDQDTERSTQVAERYGSNVLKCWDEVPLSTYDVVVISSPTPTHFSYLSTLLSKPPRLIICEKPVDLDIERLEQLVAEYQRSRVRVMVNFHRRFQPKMLALARRVQELAKEDPCRTVVVNYQRGFHNNASHAIDLLGFLFGAPFEPSNVNVLNSLADEFVEDPTISMACHWNGMQVIFVGLVDARFSHFEISLFFSKHVIKLQNGGNEVEFLSAPEDQATFYPPLRADEIWTDILCDYMTNVLAHALSMLADSSLADNFLESVNNSKIILSITQRA